MNNQSVDAIGGIANLLFAFFGRLKEFIELRTNFISTVMPVERENHV
jgi:hypothetical protein